MKKTEYLQKKNPSQHICKRGQWRKRYNRKFEDLYNEPNVVNTIKSSRMRWVGHIVQTDENELPKKILWTNLGNQQGCGQPKSRWTEGLEEDGRKLGCINWPVAVQDTTLLATFV